MKIAPGKTIGVLGGGQLGRMLALAGRNMGYRFVTLDPTEDSPCGQVADRQIVANYDDVQAALQLSASCDVITYEFENVNADVTAILMRDSYVPQGSQLLFTTQHRLREKRAIEAAGVAVAPYIEIKSAEQLRVEAERFGLPCVLKTAMGGYDGKGQWVIRSLNETAPAFEMLSKAGTELVLEKFVHFERELSVIAVRNPSGDVDSFPVAENVHVQNILHTSIVPARISDDVAARAKQMAERLAEHLGVIGLLAVEMFLTKEGQLFVNELAPRPHNSGHFTMDACTTSQFEQHIRAVCNLPLGSSKLVSPVVMVNLLGQHVAPAVAWCQHKDDELEKRGLTAKLHLYGKHDAKAQRKMGHINLLCDQVDAALEWIQQSNIWEDITHA